MAHHLDEVRIPFCKPPRGNGFELASNTSGNPQTCKGLKIFQVVTWWSHFLDEYLQSVYEMCIYIYIWVSPTPHDDNSQPQKCSKNRSGLNCWFCKWLGEVIFLVFCNQNLNQGFWGDFEGYQPCLGQSYTKPRSFQPFPGRVASGSTTCAQQRWALLNLLLAPGRDGDRTATICTS